MLKSVTIIYSITCWFEITRYNYKKAMTIAKLLETMCLEIYHWTTEITHYRGSEICSHEFKNSLIQDKYDIHDKLETVGNIQAWSIIEQVHKVLGNLIRASKLYNEYLDEDEPCKRIIAEEDFSICTTFHISNKHSPGQFVFGVDIIVPIDPVDNWRVIIRCKK